MKNLKEKLSAGEAVHGCWLNSGSEINAEIVGKAGFDWVVIDLEHGIGTENNLVNQLQALSGSPTIKIVRVEALVRQRVSRVLELGADGLLFPQIHYMNRYQPGRGHSLYLAVDYRLDSR